MDREYLEDYRQKELIEYERLTERLLEGDFFFERDKYPPDERFVRIQRPVAVGGSLRIYDLRSIWSQVPLCGSLVIPLPPLPKREFEKDLFKSSEIPEIIEFIKKRGKLQVALAKDPIAYVGLDFLDPIFEELNPPYFPAAPVGMFGSKKDVQEAEIVFETLAGIGYADLLMKVAEHMDSHPDRAFSVMWNQSRTTYITLKLNRYTIIEEIENSMVDDPVRAACILITSQMFITDSILDLRSDQRNFTSGDIRQSQILPSLYRPEELRFPSEIGRFLLKKLSYAPRELQACNQLIDCYDAYDLEKIQLSLNEAIVTNHPDIVDKSVQEFSEVLDNVWNDPAVPRRIKNLRRGIQMSIAAIGTAVSAFGGIGGFLAGLGFSVGAAFLKAEIEEISEKVGKFFAKRSYQANVYDFKKKYKDRIVRTQKKEQH